MAYEWAGPAISAVGDIVGGAMQAQEQRNADAANMAWQRELATSGIQMRVRDARRAGISPLAALGAQIYQGAPTTVGGGMGAAVREMGQDISRSMLANGSSQERQLNELAIQRGKLENGLIALEFDAKSKQADQMGPPVDEVREVPHEVTKAFQDSLGAEAGRTPKVQFVKSGQRGEWAEPFPAAGLQEALEDNFVRRTDFDIREWLLGETKPSRKDLPKGMDDWQFTPGKGWKAVKYEQFFKRYGVGRRFF